MVYCQPAAICGYGYNPDRETANVQNIELYYPNIPVVTPTLPCYSFKKEAQLMYEGAFTAFTHQSLLTGLGKRVGQYIDISML